MSSVLHMQRMLLPSTSYKYAYILLDTNNASPELSNGSVFGWNVLNFVSLQKGVVSVIGQLRDIIAMRLYPVTAIFNSPIPVPGKIWINNVINLNYNMTILIKEFQAQAYVGHNGIKFHFAMYPQVMNYDHNMIGFPLIPTRPYIEYNTISKGDGWFWFKTPITTVSTMTISIGDPFNLLTQSTNRRTLIQLQLIYTDVTSDN